MSGGLAGRNWNTLHAARVAKRPPEQRLDTDFVRSPASGGADPEVGTLERKSPVLMIRLARFGARKQPYYRIVVIEKDRARNGRSIEVVGTYNPRTNPATVDLKRERIQYWTGNGAQMSEIVAKLVSKAPQAETVTA